MDRRARTWREVPRGDVGPKPPRECQWHVRLDRLFKNDVLVSHCLVIPAHTIAAAVRVAPAFRTDTLRFPLLLGSKDGMSESIFSSLKKSTRARSYRAIACCDCPTHSSAQQPGSQMTNPNEPSSSRK
jgi:hypothetical protein